MKLLRKTRALRELQKLVTMMATCCLAHDICYVLLCSVGGFGVKSLRSRDENDEFCRGASE